MKKSLFVVSILFAAACGGKSKGDSGDPCKDPCKDQKLAAMTCEAMASNVAAATSGDGSPADVAEGMRGIFADQCTSMAWSQETIDCIGASTTNDEGKACVDNMSEEQSASLHAELDKWEAGGGGEEGVE